MSALEEQEAAEAEEAANEQPDEELDTDDELLVDDQVGGVDAAATVATDEAVRCEASTVAGGQTYRCALQAEHDGDHAFAAVDDTDTGEPELSAQAAQTDKEKRKVREQLENEAARHLKRLGEILGPAVEGLHNCELCDPNFAGWRPDMAPREDVIARVRPVIGLPALDNLEPSSTSRRCEVCNGKGQVKTGSDDPRYEKEKCDPCNGKGYVRTRPLVNNPDEVEEPSENGQPPQARWDDDVIRDMFGTPITDEDYGKMPALRKRPIEYWQTHQA